MRAVGTTERTCTSTEAKGRFVYVTLDGDTEFSGVSLACFAEGGTPQPPTQPPVLAPIEEPNILKSGKVLSGIAIPVGQAVFYTMPMPSNADSVRCSISGGTGDADLYVRWDEEVDLNTPSNNNVSRWETSF